MRRSTPEDYRRYTEIAKTRMGWWKRHSIWSVWYELLDAERLMLQDGIEPAPMFRFERWLTPEEK